MKRLLVLVISLALALPSVFIQASAADASIPIYNEADLYYIADNPGGSYELMCDINCADFCTIPTFSGRLNGNGYQIMTNGSRMFETVESGAVITDLSVVGRSDGAERYFATDEPASNKYGGVVAGVFRGTMERCAVYGSVSGSTLASGGVTGIVDGGRISDCSFKGSVTANSGCAGGFAGKLSNAVIERCYANIDVSGTAPEKGNFAGNSSSSQVSGCYTSSGLESFGIGVGADTVTALDDTAKFSAAYYPAFNFDDTWTIIEGETLPLLISIYGRGTEAQPYRLHGQSYQYSEIYAMMKNGTNGLGPVYLRMDSDWDASSNSLLMVGDDQNRFSGVFDGNGHVIKGLNCPLLGAIDAAGAVKNLTIISTEIRNADVFGYVTKVNYGTIENCHVTSNGLNGSKDLGGIAGENINGTITHSSFRGNISGTESGIGGIAGYNSFGTITECAVKNSSIIGEDHSVGGITGDNSNGTIENCLVYNANVCSDGGEVGGIAGRLYNGVIRRCFANWQSRDLSFPNISAIAGGIIESGTVENCYYNTDFAPYAIGGTENTDGAVSGDTIKNPASYPGLDFTSTWTLDEECGPALLSLSGAGTRENPYIIRCDEDLTDADDGISVSGERNYYVLGNNLYLELHHGTTFSGSINGAGHRIIVNGSRLPDLSKGGYLGNAVVVNGIFDSAQNAKIEKCVFIGSGRCANTISGSTVSGCAVIFRKNNPESPRINGGFALQISDGSEISDCVVRKAELGGEICGGFAGSVSGSRVTNCYALDCRLCGSSAAGGFVGRNDNSSSIKNCAARGEIETKDGSYTGSFAGMNYAEIASSYGVNTKADSKTIGFAGHDEGSIKESGVSDFTVPYISFGGYGVSVYDTTVYTTEVQVPEPGGLSDISGHWAEKTINNLVSGGIINGYEDGTFRPELSVTKGEYIKLLMAAAGQPTDDNFTQYSDVNASWARQYVSRAVYIGICGDIPVTDTYFGVDEPITRAQAAAITGRLLAPGKGGTLSFTDAAAIPAWAAEPIGACVNIGLITGNDDGSFSPDGSLTRAEAATIIERVINLDNK